MIDRPAHKPTALLTAMAAVCALLLAPLSPAAAGETRLLGDGVDLPEATRIADILGDPDAYIGKTVRVEGGVLDVCPRKGCWIELGEAGESIRIKVEDDVIVFPADAKGRAATAQGEVEALDMTREKYVGWLAHLAEERGEAFDPESADIGDGPYRIIRIRGTGARID